MSSAIVPPQPIRREFWERPKARFFGFLSLVCGTVVVLAPALLMIGPDAPVVERNSTEIDRLRSFAWCAIASEVVFILLAVAFWRFEKPRRVIHQVLPGDSVIH